MPAVVVPNNLPVWLTSFIGRRDERTTVSELIAEHRLVTLTGSGGCGKTRLAIEVASRIADGYPDGVWWIDLARLSDPVLVANTIATEVGVKEVPGQPLVDTLAEHLRQARSLLLLDNCEHLIASSAALADELLKGCPSLSILGTSREPLGLAGEVSWRVPSLALPEEGASLESVARSEAVQLFVERARRVRSTFALSADNALAVAEMCRRLDGMPLALELAAARVRMMTPEQVLAGLEDRFRLLSGSGRTVLPRQQTLRASVDWSHDLLDDHERIVLRRLSVFAGGFTLDAAEQVCAGDGIAREAVLDILGRLVDRSMVHVGEETPVSRYRLLETIRQYATDRLVWSGEQEPVRASHLRFYSAFAGSAEPHLQGERLFEWLRLLDAENDNIRAAIDWGVRSGASEETVRLVSSLWLYWAIRGHLTEGRARFEEAVRFSVPRTAARAKALIGAGSLETYHGDLESTARSAQEALDIARELGDLRLEGEALETLAYATAFLDPPAAPDLFRASVELSRESGDLWFLADALNGWGIARMLSGDYAGAVDVLDESVASSRRSGNPFTLMHGLGVLGFVRAHQGDLEQADGLLTECLEIARALGDRVFTAEALFGLGFVEAHRGRADAAESLLKESIEIARAVSPLMLSFALITQGLARFIRGDAAGAVPCSEEAVALGEAMGMRWTIAWGSAILARAGHRPAGEAATEAKAAGLRLDVVFDAEARLARASGDVERAESLHHEALGAAMDAGSVLLVPAQLEALGGLAAHAESPLEAGRLFGAAEAARDRLGLIRYAADQDGYASDVALGRDGAGDAFEEALREGRTLTIEEAVAYASRGRGERKRPSTGWASLTPTELEVVRHVAEGLTNPQIAERLFVSRSTVKAHLNHIFTKLAVATRAELAAAATRREAVPPESRK